jgi:hypothetical protein
MCYNRRDLWLEKRSSCCDMDESAPGSSQYPAHKCPPFPSQRWPYELGAGYFSVLVSQRWFEKVWLFRASTEKVLVEAGPILAAKPLSIVSHIDNSSKRGQFKQLVLTRKAKTCQGRCILDPFHSRWQMIPLAYPGRFGIAIFSMGRIADALERLSDEGLEQCGPALHS